MNTVKQEIKAVDVAKALPTMKKVETPVNGEKEVAKAMIEKFNPKTPPIKTVKFSYIYANLINTRVHSFILRMCIHLVHKTSSINQILKRIREVCRIHWPQ